MEALEGANGCLPCPLQLRLHHAADEDEQVRFGPVEQVGGRVWHSNHPSTVCGGPSLRRPNRLRGRSRGPSRCGGRRAYEPSGSVMASAWSGREIRGGERPGDGVRVEHRLRFSIIPAWSFSRCRSPAGARLSRASRSTVADVLEQLGGRGSRPGILGSWSRQASYSAWRVRRLVDGVNPPLRSRPAVLSAARPSGAARRRRGARGIGTGARRSSCPRGYCTTLEDARGCGGGQGGGTLPSSRRADGAEAPRFGLAEDWAGRRVNSATGSAKSAR